MDHHEYREIAADMKREKLLQEVYGSYPSKRVTGYRDDYEDFTRSAHVNHQQRRSPEYPEKKSSSSTNLVRREFFFC